jgi:hypothetical protein
MLAYQKTLYDLIQEVGIGDETLVQESYYELEQAFLDRWTTMLVAQLSDEDQKLVSEKLEAGATPEQFYEFMDASIDNIEEINQKILEDFVSQYREMMDMD